MTGVPIYLVSACTTGEEFVAAFRRYADRGSLFVPIAEPIPTGRRGRFAVTLTSGGVMLEGEGEVISSAKTPSILHGRIGMTIRFAELDDASKTVLIELEKARLATQPVAPSVAPRAADVPAAPRAKPPAVTARIDAHTALAECVAIGDVDALVTSAAAPPKAGPKFVMPAVLPVGQRPKTPSGPQAIVTRPKTPSGPQPIVTRPKTPSTPPSLAPIGARPKTPSIPPAMPSLPVPVAMPPSKSGPIASSVPAAMPPSKSGPIAGSVPVAIAPTKSGPIAGSVPVAIAPTKSGPIAGPPPVAKRPLTGEGPTAVTSPLVPPDKPAQIMAAVTATPTPTEMTAVNVTAPITAPMPAAVPIKHTRDDETRPSPIRVAAAARREDPTPAKPIRVTPPPMPAQRVTPPLPIKPPIVGTAPDRKVLVSDLDETTDVTTMPAPGPDDPGTGRRTTLGVAVSPGGMVLPAVIADAEEAKPTEVVEAQHAPISNKQPTVEEPTPSGDWTITPGADGPTIEPRPASHEPRPASRDSKPGVEEETPVVQQDIPLPVAKPRRQTGDWTIQLDSDSPDGWSEPAKVDKLPPVIVEPPKPKARPKQAENPPELAPVARSIMVESQIEPKPEPAVASDEPKIQIDPTLMEAPIVDLARVDLASPAPEVRPRTATPLPMQAVHHEISHEPSGRPRLPTPVPGMPAVAPEMPIEMLVPMGMGVELPPGVAMVPELERPGLGTGGSPVLRQNLIDVPVGTPDPRIATPAPGELRLPTPLPMPMPTPVPGTMRDTPLPQMSRDQMAAMINPAARGLTDGGTGFFRESGEIANLSGSFAMVDATAAARSRRTRIIVIAVSAALVLAIGIGLLLTLGGDKKSDEPIAVPPPAVDAPAAVVMIDAADIVAPTVDAADVKPPPPPEQCTVEVTSVPPAADIVDEANATLGTTPATLPLPCGKEVKLTIKKLRFATTVRPVTATAEGAKLRVLLQKLMFQIKVSSQPAGASVSLNGKAGAAITPSVMKVPAFDTSTVTFTKDGYEPMAVKVQAKQNNQTVHAQLKKKKK